MLPLLLTIVVSAYAQAPAAAPGTGARVFHPAVANVEIWPGPHGYPWADTGIRVWTREALLRRVGPNELLCTWTTGGFTEPWPGNFTMISRSTDGGKTWAPAGKFAHPTRGLFTTELFVPRPGEVHAFLQTYGAGVWMTQLHSYRAISKDGGRTWDGPHSIPGGIQNVWVAGGIVHSSGRWIIPVSWAELTGDEWAEPSVGRAPMQGQVGDRLLKQAEMPAGADSELQYRTGNAWADRNHRYVAGAMVSDDAGRTFQLRGHITGGAHGWLIEPRIVELSDGRIVMLIRSQRDGWLWRSESADRGNSWGRAVQSDIPNPGSKVNLQRSRDGRIFLLHNPSPGTAGQMGPRNPLSLWISRDDMKSWSVKADLVKVPGARVSLNYPDGFLDEESGNLVFAWEDARSVFLMRVPMDLR
jgi:hypothetical protein